ncbi:E3 ubiquitin-protein ligase RNF8 [Chionoecetes opilio]|uniref:E3 ubiquitin-protein ligase RNF8 n=1 Tax=Chionoecetes opilio TaxID=41210 RepID=A0A8J5CSV5_CHIOP|nr:E3 ubiquitin-protein ligase RNF8 [Chionoecetes opilio]
MLLLDAVYFSHRRTTPLSSFSLTSSTNSITGAIFWLLLSGGHCPQLVDDMNAPAALMVHHVGSQDVEVGRKLDFPLRIRSIVDRLNDSIGTPGRAHRCRTSFGLSPSPQKKHSFWGIGAGAAGDSRRRGPPVGLYEFAFRSPLGQHTPNILLGRPRSKDHISIAKLQTELEEERKVLEERLKQEEERNRVLQEKENELRQLAEEKACLEEKQEEERQRLQKQLLDTETHKEELKQQVEAKNSAIQAKEAEYQLAKEEKELLEHQLAQERLTREEEKYQMQEELMHTKAQDQLELEGTLDALKAEKDDLSAQLASSVMGSSEAKKELVDSVSNVLEDELQCAICNEMFINAVLLGCSHTFCKYCIDRWKKTKRECPNCRLPITSESRSLVVDNFIEKVVPTLSEEMKKKRVQLLLPLLPPEEAEGEVTGYEAIIECEEEELKEGKYNKSSILATWGLTDSKLAIRCKITQLFS